MVPSLFIILLFFLALFFGRFSKSFLSKLGSWCCTCILTRLAPGKILYVNDCYVSSNIVTMYSWPSTVLRTEVGVLASFKPHMNRYYYLHFIDEGN